MALSLPSVSFLRELAASVRARCCLVAAPDVQGHQARHFLIPRLHAAHFRTRAATCALPHPTAQASAAQSAVRTLSHFCLPWSTSKRLPCGLANCSLHICGKISTAFQVVGHLVLHKYWALYDNTNRSSTHGLFSFAPPILSCLVAMPTTACKICGNSCTGWRATRAPIPRPPTESPSATRPLDYLDAAAYSRLCLLFLPLYTEACARLVLSRHCLRLLTAVACVDTWSVSQSVSHSITLAIVPHQRESILAAHKAGSIALACEMLLQNATCCFNCCDMCIVPECAASQHLHASVCCYLLCIEKCLRACHARKNQSVCVTLAMLLCVLHRILKSSGHATIAGALAPSASACTGSGNWEG